MERLIKVMLVLLLVLSFTGCQQNDKKDALTAVCTNGRFIGKAEEETGVLSFKGIPYAKAPVGELRWKAPQTPDACDETFEAYEYGKSSIQYKWFSEPIQTEVGEDCLTLNVWTNDLNTKGKAVMVFFHGGAFAWGGTSEPIYNGQYIVNEHNDVVVVTCNYRIGMMGFIDLSSVEGSEEYGDSTQLGLLDCIESLRWVRENIEAFGGDPNNVTVFGESAGSTIVACLLASDVAGELFNRAICQSGGVTLTNDKAQYEAQTNQIDALMALSGAKNMDDLMALSEEELIELNEYALDEDGTCINDLYMLPLRGGICPSDPYEALSNVKAKNVDLLIGTNYDEANYWVAEMTDRTLSLLTQEEIDECIEMFNAYMLGEHLDDMLGYLSGEEQAAAYAYINQADDEIAARSILLSDCMFRASSIKMAECHASGDGTGRTYMYLFNKTNNIYPFMGANHSIDLPYVFHNLQRGDYYGDVDKDLADRVCEAWVNFAKTGDPSIASFTWSEYNAVSRETAIVNDDGTLEMEGDPLQEERILTQGIADHYCAAVGL